MDDEYTFELDEVFHTIQTAEVITFRFVVINQRLLVDSRHTEIDAPLIKVVPKVSSAYERFRSLKKLRPRFRVPDKICSVAWPKRVETLVTSGVWSSIVDRVSQAGFADAQSRCEEALRELFDLERREIHKAIEGDGYGTLWEHTP
jgi:hypothetical protein